MTFAEIYNYLFTGKSLELSFSDAALAENFRTRMHHYKTVQDKLMLGTGLIDETELQMFSFKVLRKSEDYTTYILRFHNTKIIRQYAVKIVDTEETSDGS